MDTKALRQKILDLAIRGKLVPQDPTDEPASVLLERIRAERQRLVKEGKLKAKDVKNDSIIYKDPSDNLHYEKFSDGTIKCIEDEIPFDIPEFWAWVRLNTCCAKEIKRGKAPKYILKSNTLVFAQKCNTKSGEIKLSLAQFLDEETLKKYSEDDFTQNNDIIINSTGTGTLGRVGIYTNKDNPSNLTIVPDSHITTVRVLGELNAKMVFLWLKFNQAYLEDQGEGSTNQKELRPNTLAEMLIPIPPLAEQLRIESSYNSIIYLMNYLDTKKLEVSKCVELTKSKILDLAIRGKLVPQDPNDEPASELLERIKAEKDELIKQGKIKRDKAESTIFKGVDNSYYEKLPSGWTITNLETVIDYEQPTEYLVNSTDYKNEYPTPVLTAGKSLILGYTNETNGIFTDTPVIIFDDFTTECKYVDFPFKIKSTAMKILHPNKSAILSKYAYYLMKTIQVDHENHQRYWISTFCKEHILLPPLNEQQRIIDCIELYFGLLDGIAN